MYTVPQKEKSVFAFIGCTLDSNFMLCIYLVGLMNSKWVILDLKLNPCSKKEA